VLSETVGAGRGTVDELKMRYTSDHWIQLQIAIFLTLVKVVEAWLLV
jgi:hypothetical protein